MPGEYARDQNIGPTQTDTPVTVQNLSEVIEAVDDAKAVTEDTLIELKKIRRGTELTVGQEIGEVE